MWRWSINAATTWIGRLKPHLERCGYHSALLRENYGFGGVQIPLVAFAQEPFDARSACIAVVDSEKDPERTIAAYREVGAPIVLRPSGEGALEWWSQGSASPLLREEIALPQLREFFRKHQDEFSPQAVYRAKTRGRLTQAYQLEFVDVGLMPFVEHEIGEKLARLVERILVPLRERAGWSDPTPAQGRILVRHTFWLLAGKILHDKRVPSFERLDLGDAAEVLRRVRAHYGAVEFLPESREKFPRKPLDQAAEQIAGYASLAHVTTEALAEVYESSLITPETRRALGVHSTPPWLIDYVLLRLEPWIKELPSERRTILEPACGQAAFLTAGMRMLRELLPLRTSGPKRRRYLRAHLMGIEVDPFALELARLSLTLADIPYPNGWKLTNQDMFSGDVLERSAREASILLANPPFEDFNKSERASTKPRLLNKTAEMLRRVLSSLAPGSVFGVIVPRGFLDVSGASSLRELILREFELEEVTLFPDKVFRFSDMECAVLLGRRRRAGPRGEHVRYRWVRERDVDEFRRTYTADEKAIPRRFFESSETHSLFAPQLGEVWEVLGHFPKLGSIARCGEGLSFRNSPGTRTHSQERFEGAVKGFVRLGSGLELHGRPPESYMNLTPEALSRRRNGAEAGTPQILMNHARVARGPWRIKAFVDREGHPCTNNFNTVRPRVTSWPLEYIWALLNSPLANAFVYTHSWRRHNLPGIVESIPIPAVSANSPEASTIAGLALEYLSEANKPTDGLEAAVDDRAEKLRRILLRLDAEVLKLYSLAPRLERKLLDLFAGYSREGVPFELTSYYPADFRPSFNLHEYLSEEYQKSTAGALLARPQTEIPASIRTALKRAREDFQE